MSAGSVQNVNRELRTLHVLEKGGIGDCKALALAQTDAVKAEMAESSRFKDAHLDKARIHSYLAWNDPPGIPLGQAVLKRTLDPESKQASIFLRWIRDVFEFHGNPGVHER